MLNMRINGSSVVLRVGGQAQTAEALIAEYLIANVNTLRTLVPGMCALLLLTIQG